jgi:hypothetical protein
MGRDELDSIAQAEFGFEVSEFVSGPPIFHAIEIRGLGVIRAIGGEGFDAGVDGDERIVIGTDHGRENGHGVLKVDADSAICQVHHDVGSGLDFRHVRQVEIDVPGSGAASGEDFAGEPFTRKQLTDRRGCLKRRFGNVFSLGRRLAVRSAD